jgi:hypothetical protein
MLNSPQKGPHKSVQSGIMFVRCSLPGLTTATPEGILFAACNSSLVQSGKLRNYP